jgi:hypothetical protein
MNIKKISVASGAMLLAAVAVFAGVKKFAGPITQVFYTISGVCHSFNVASGVQNFTTGGSGTQATIKTSGGSSGHNLWGVCSGATKGSPVHFKVL